MPRPLRLILFGFILPSALYALIYYLFSFPLWHSFSTHFFCGQEDGYQNIWNLWWVNKAVTELHQSPWYTTWLHYPTGTTLIAHTLAPFNGFVGIVLFKLGMSLNQVYNSIVIFSFVMTGVTTFWLAWRVTGSYIGSLFAGAAFTFCHFHFAHAQNHLQMVTLEWLPLAVLAVYEMLTRPTILKSIGAAAALFLVALSDFHLTFYVVVAGCLLGIVTFARLARTGFVDVKKYAIPLALFMTLMSASTGLLAYKLLKVNKTDELQQNHDPVIWSTDIIDPAIPSAQWRFNEITKPIWSVLATPDKDFIYIEHSLYIGWSVILLCGLAVARWRNVGVKDLGYWFGLLFLFGALSMGPKLHFFGHVSPIPGVYPVLETLFPPLKMGGVPMRLMAMVFLSGAVIAAGAVEQLMRISGRGRWLFITFLIAVWTFESLPKAQPITPAKYPYWVTKLHDLPDGAVLDMHFKTNMFVHLFYATGHGKPTGEGYISRYPKSVDEKRGRLRSLVDSAMTHSASDKKEDQEEWEKERDRLQKEWGFKYLVVDHHMPGLKALVQDGDVRVYQLSK
jgi:hypothetical protein